MEEQDSTHESREYTEYCSYLTADEAFPIRIPLESAVIGPVKYTIPERGEIGDLELLYELETSDFLIYSAVCGRRGEPPGTLRISNIQAADLSVFSEVPGSLEGLVARLVVETTNDVVFQSALLSEGEEDAVSCHRIVVTASIHECGHLRDMLLFLKSDVHFLASEIPENNPYISPIKRHHHQQQQLKESDGDKNNGLTLMEGLPQWALYIPWWLYSGRVRRAIQFCLILYTIFSVVWASWQLYRHFNIIQVALQPIVAALKVYLPTLMELLDVTLDKFTDLWTSFLSPLNIFSSIALAPLISLATRLLSPIISVARLAPRPFHLLWQGLLNSRQAVQSLDLVRIRQNLVISLFISTFKAIWMGLAKLFNFHSKKVKQKQAIQATASSVATSPSVIFSPHQELGQRRNYPVYYNSPISTRK